ncbi:MAG TPA: hypothetical protein VFS10_01235 [Pyrinomonadaceae bacterium]|nr:hypothetical protein [Pyrinomonadaceae bacterium]
MDWMNQLGGLLKQYSGAQPEQAPDTVEDDFDQLTQAAPGSALADGLSAAFRSEQTPPFGQMLGQLFGQSDGTQRASILNTLISALGPTIVAQILSRAGGGGGLAGMLGGGQTEVTPEQAEAIPPQVVEEVAAEAEKRDPSVVDMISNVYAKNPTLFKTLGAAALTIALAKIADRQQRG